MVLETEYAVMLRLRDGVEQRGPCWCMLGQRCHFVFALVAVGCLGGCNVFEPRDCAAIALPGITVATIDSATAAQVQADTVSIGLVDGLYVEEARVPSAVASTPLGFAVERPGAYAVAVAASGYLPWEVQDVRVRQGECNVETVNLTARL